MLLTDIAGFLAPEFNSIKKCICMETGSIGDMRKYGTTNSYQSKLQCLTFPAEAAGMILKVDDIVKCVSRPREQGKH